MSQQEVNNLIRSNIPKGALIYQIFADRKSIFTFGQMRKANEIRYYLGVSPSKEIVSETIKQGLNASLTTPDYDFGAVFSILSRKNLGFLVMLGLPVKQAKKFRELALEEEVKNLLVYPEV